MKPISRSNISAVSKRSLREEPPDRDSGGNPGRTRSESCDCHSVGYWGYGESWAAEPWGSGPKKERIMRLPLWRILGIGGILGGGPRGMGASRAGAQFFRGGYPPPVWVAPSPVVIAPAPVLVAPRRVIVRPARVIVTSPP